MRCVHHPQHIQENRTLSMSGREMPQVERCHNRLEESGIEGYPRSLAFTMKSQFCGFEVGLVGEHGDGAANVPHALTFECLSQERKAAADHGVVETSGFRPARRADPAWRDCCECELLRLHDCAVLGKHRV